MAAQEVNTLRELYGAIGRGDDADSVLDAFDPDVEVLEDPDVPGSATYRGREGIRTWAKRWRDFADLNVETLRFIESERGIVVLLGVEAPGEEGRAGVEARFGHLWKMREGRALRVQLYLDWTKALEAVGLRP